MLGYAVRRIAGTVPTLLILVTLSFFVIRLAPGGPFDEERALTPQVRANLDHLYGFDQPLAVQYLHYLEGLAHGDFGVSYKLRDDSVADLIAQGLPVSVTVGFAALALAMLLGVPLGIWAALRGAGAVDYLVTALATVAIALPTFVTGPLLALVFGLALRWLPVSGWQQGDPFYLVLPAVTLALPVGATIARMMRGSLLETLSASFVRTARARGLGPWRVLLHHALRPALLPVVSYLGPAATYVFTGSLVVETVFALPGTGRYLVQGALNRDYTLVMGMIILYGALTLLLNLAADLVYGLLDPRVRHD
ncbi:MAG TPA: ABC transporter permease subunit [Steroidobacteraceae bacterium]|nr:ABC transporter permease subunit [Steroidobacteraceae bacterium]